MLQSVRPPTYRAVSVGSGTELQQRPHHLGMPRGTGYVECRFVTLLREHP